MFALPAKGCNDRHTDGDDPPIIEFPDVPTMEIDIDPAWSPDGSTVICYRRIAQGYNYADTSWQWGVFQYDVASKETPALWENFQARHIDWSADGQRIAFSYNAQIYIRELTTGLTSHIACSERCFFPRWSPCDDRLIYFVRAGVNRGMYVYDTLANSSKLCVRYATMGSSLGNCDSVVLNRYSTSPLGNLSIYSISDTSLVDLPGVQVNKRWIASSPDGEAVLVSVEAGTNHVNIWRYDVNLRSYLQLTTEGGDYPAWSPDGQWIVYTKRDSLNGHLWLMRPDGSEKHQITFRALLKLG